MSFVENTTAFAGKIRNKFAPFPAINPIQPSFFIIVRYNSTTEFDFNPCSPVYGIGGERERRKGERINEKYSHTVMRGGGRGRRRILHSWSTGSKAKQSKSHNDPTIPNNHNACNVPAITF
jgi:hypothetical protein